ncbi:hypothetical protein FZC84_21990 [Rossellomorea vietnamensis]|uniref:Uncharacterized protein n=1 Tax=Rossellomorea vietnamensis TaxID=218284 RepID=A0A5D4M1R3_9BACI|nr:hypothetical protein FZC84_21990 [Rossellomorea vietnamensis]
MKKPHEVKYITLISCGFIFDYFNLHRLVFNLCPSLFLCLRNYPLWITYSFVIHVQLQRLRVRTHWNGLSPSGSNNPKRIKGKTAFFSLWNICLSGLTKALALLFFKVSIVTD